ncbi:lysoplasmalogenase [Spirosoma pollinicola]|uniref:Lysoplasmalogenase n=1 Tax=Spirosoma pollinicola TaxID=2057025 RepID=A0A2K8YY06_9BACT|nr:lysoplasmalogenase [Spirosoma pollinicola]AUD02479.1 lysoplasmalogenase [Spirosoma pollinicola]
MSTTPTRSFTIIFALITLLEMIGDTLHIRWLHYGSKPLIMALLFLYVWQHYRLAGSPHIIRWLMIGMVFALLGDVFLMIREVDLFALGLGSFLIMQLCYCRAFWLLIYRAKQPLRVQTLWKTSVPFLIYDLAFLILLYPVFVNNPSLTPLWWPVVIYVFCLSTMGLLATQVDRFQLHDLLNRGSLVVGALLFILSDSAIAIDKFLHPIPGATWVVMTTYAAAQYLIVVGLVQQTSPA